MAKPTGESTAIMAAEGGTGKSAYVRETFSAIAPRYDLLNHLLSFNVDKRWRRRAIAALELERNPAGRYLDLCAGTLDVSAALCATKGFDGSVIAVDFAQPMLDAGREKIRGARIDPVAADALRLPLSSQSMSGAVVAFGIRNVDDLDAALREVHRVLEPGSRFVILEFATPRSRLINAGYQVYFNHVLPAIGGWISGHRTAYRYLPRSVENFPAPGDLAQRMSAAGFIDVQWAPLTAGIAAIHSGIRNGHTVTDSPFMRSPAA